MTQTDWPCLRPDARHSSSASILDVSVSPNAKKTELVGWHDGALRVRLNAPPVDGAANDALRKWLSKELSLAQNQITLLRGAASRRKQWHIAMPTHEVAAWLATHKVLTSP